MSSPIRDAATELLRALRLVPGVHVYTDPAAVQEYPALVSVPPNLSYNTGSPGPSDARFPVFVVVQADENATFTLWDLVGEVSVAVDEHTAGVVMAADLTTFGNLPAYQIQVDMPLEAL